MLTPKVCIEIIVVVGQLSNERCESDEIVCRGVWYHPNAVADEDGGALLSIAEIDTTREVVAADEVVIATSVVNDKQVSDCIVDGAKYDREAI